MKYHTRPIDEISCCLECNAHEVLPDPEPGDRFCDDSVAVRCMAADQSKTTYYKESIRAGEPYVTVACRPYDMRKETKIPDWCPRKCLTKA